MSDILEEASALVQCRECPWYRTCVTPMRYTSEDLRRQMQSTIPGAAAAMGETELQSFLANIAAAAQSLILEGCPIFIQRLRTSPRLAIKIKQIMQNWASETRDEVSDN
ncbi:MAG: hypothetical protein HYU86_10000 [Chloroflexi bacterium]|nr:hypothetical protein [Chloroflexota bacterium]